MNGVELQWSWHPSVIIGTALLSLAYLLVAGLLPGKIGAATKLPVGRPSRGRLLAFAGAQVLLLLTLLSPLDELGDSTLFSAHMLQHMLLIFFIPPLWIASLTPEMADRLFPPGGLRQAWAFLTHPVIAFLIFNGLTWLWHIPAAYDAALANEPLHVVEHLFFMASGVIGWWVAIGPRQFSRLRLGEPGKILYLFLSTFPCTALAALLTLSSQVFYTFYATAPWSAGIDPLVDQQAGGLLMWLPGDMVFLLVILILVIRWMQGFDTYGRLGRAGLAAPQPGISPAKRL